MTREKAIKVLREAYCENRVFCELFRVDRCRTTDCEIYHAIKALETEPNSCEYWDSESHFCALSRPQAEPMAHSHWIEHSFESYIPIEEDANGNLIVHKYIGGTCSNCGFQIGGLHRIYNYCPICGERMRKVGEDG